MNIQRINSSNFASLSDLISMCNFSMKSDYPALDMLIDNASKRRD
ncbi:hypothetical protein [Vibrio salinus]|nr:hypothetical protein [Vibrio salinus]